MIGCNTEGGLEEVNNGLQMNNAKLCWNNSSGDVAYIAGSVVVFYSPVFGVQKQFFVGRIRRKIACIAVSPDGRFLAIGEVSLVLLFFWLFQDVVDAGRLLGCGACV